MGFLSLSESGVGWVSLAGTPFQWVVKIEQSREKEEEEGESEEDGLRGEIEVKGNRMEK